jgi:hypothetical protein
VGTRDLEQRAGEARGISRELHGRRIGQAFAMTRYGSLQQPSEEYADVTQQHHGERREHERTRTVLAAAPAHVRRAVQHGARNNGDGQQPERPA